MSYHELSELSCGTSKVCWGKDGEGELSVGAADVSFTSCIVRAYVMHLYII